MPPTDPNHFYGSLTPAEHHDYHDYVIASPTTGPRELTVINDGEPHRHQRRAPVTQSLASDLRPAEGTGLRPANAA